MFRGLPTWESWSRQNLNANYGFWWNYRITARMGFVKLMLAGFFPKFLKFSEGTGLSALCDRLTYRLSILTIDSPSGIN